jgi:hypothetical protein
MKRSSTAQISRSRPIRLLRGAGTGVVRAIAADLSSPTLES